MALYLLTLLTTTEGFPHTCSTSSIFYKMLPVP